MKYFFNERVRAKCPRCQQWHTVALEYPWIGKGTVRLFCDPCRERIRNHETPREQKLKEITKILDS
jgi:hypothetical protein